MGGRLTTDRSAGAGWPREADRRAAGAPARRQWFAAALVVAGDPCRGGRRDRDLGPRRRPGSWPARRCSSTLVLLAGAPSRRCGRPRLAAASGWGSASGRRASPPSPPPSRTASPPRDPERRRRPAARRAPPGGLRPGDHGGRPVAPRRLDRPDRRRHRRRRARASSSSRSCGPSSAPPTSRPRRMAVGIAAGVLAAFLVGAAVRLAITGASRLAVRPLRDRGRARARGRVDPPAHLPARSSPRTTPAGSEPGSASRRPWCWRPPPSTPRPPASPSGSTAPAHELSHAAPGAADAGRGVGARCAPSSCSLRGEPVDGLAARRVHRACCWCWWPCASSWWCARARRRPRREVTVRDAAGALGSSRDAPAIRQVALEAARDLLGRPAPLRGVDRGERARRDLPDRAARTRTARSTALRRGHRRRPPAGRRHRRPADAAASTAAATTS